MDLILIIIILVLLFGGGFGYHRWGYGGGIGIGGILLIVLIASLLLRRGGFCFSEGGLSRARVMPQPPSPIRWSNSLTRQRATPLADLLDRGSQQTPRWR